MSTSRPRVFQPGTVTVVFGKDGQSVHVGAVEITMAESVRADDDGVHFFMRKPVTEAEHLRLDEETRASRACDLVTIMRS